jgi:3',5'-cyclic AMP phosphodiesterase CpdA
MHRTRRQFLSEAALGAGAGALALAGCGGSGSGPAGAAASRSGSTLLSTWGDPIGSGQLQIGPGERLVQRLELGPRAAGAGVLATLAHLTDAHVLDASSPARVTFLNRLGAPFQSTFRPQEALTVQVLAGAVAAVRALRPDVVVQGGDLIDNVQSNELVHALAVLGGGVVHPGSGPDGYYGVQLASDPDPFYYRPNIDAPRYPGLLTEAVRAFACRGLDAPCLPVLGDHDALVAGELVPTPLTRSLAVGGRALWDLPAGLKLPPGFRVQPGASGGEASPDGPPDPVLVGELLSRALAGPTVPVPPDAARKELTFAEVIAGLRGASSRLATGPGARLDYSVDIGAHLRLLVLDLARRDGGSGGLVAAGQPQWLAAQLSAAGQRWLIVVSHQPLADSLDGGQILDLLDRTPSVIATLAGHTHRNRITPRPSTAGGYWQIETASLIDYPQQARALRLLATTGGGVALQTWMLDHVFPSSLGTISRELSYLDAQGGRPQDFAGGRLDRNVVLYRRPAG